MARHRLTVRDALRDAFELAAVEWRAVAIAALERHMTDAFPSSKREGARGRAKEDPRIAVILRQRVLAHRLLPREAEILEAAVHGLDREKIRRRLGIGTNTFKTHVHGLMRKLGTATLDGAVIDVLREALDLSMPAR